MRGKVELIEKWRKIDKACDKCNSVKVVKWKWKPDKQIICTTCMLNKMDSEG